MRVRCIGSKTLSHLVSILQSVDPTIEVGGEVDVTLSDIDKPIAGRVVRVDHHAVPRQDGDDDLDRLALQARFVAGALGLAPSDTPYLRSLRPDERRIRGGRATSLAEAEGWLREIGGFPAEHVERLAPTLLPLSAMKALVKGSVEYQRFFAHVESRCSDERYGALQAKFLNYRALHRLAAVTGPTPKFIYPEKYLYLPYWSSRKLRAATTLDLHRRDRAVILDLGAGPGHFALVCDYFGHEYWGVDIPFSYTTPFSRHDMYGDLFECFGFQRLIQRIMANTPLEVPRRFDLVVAQMATFCTHRTETGPVPWQWPDWQFFLRDLVQNVVAPRFEMFFEINRAYLPQTVTDALAALGASVDLKDSIIRINHAQTDAILAR